MFSEELEILQEKIGWKRVGILLPESGVLLPVLEGL
jgi:hypothetical protein